SRLRLRRTAGWGAARTARPQRPGSRRGRPDTGGGGGPSLLAIGGGFHPFSKVFLELCQVRKDLVASFALAERPRHGDGGRKEGQEEDEADGRGSKQNPRPLKRQEEDDDHRGRQKEGREDSLDPQQGLPR